MVDAYHVNEGGPDMVDYYDPREDGKEAWNKTVRSHADLPAIIFETSTVHARNNAPFVGHPNGTTSVICIFYTANEPSLLGM